MCIDFYHVRESFINLQVEEEGRKRGAEDEKKKKRTAAERYGALCQQVETFEL